MTIPLTPEVLAAAYDYLSTLPPMSSWNLPHSEDIVFRVVRSRKIFGQTNFHLRLKIEISEASVGRHETLLTTMAHEQIHVFQHTSCILRHRNVHDAAFHKIADQICAIHDWDRKLF